MGKCTGISFVDSTPIRVCRNQRIHIHRTFKGIAQRGKCSMGWFLGFKLHLICNEKGELLNFMITPGDIDDREPLKYNAFVEFLYGKLVGDKGYIGKELFQRLFVNGIQLITKLKSNMKGTLMSVSDKLLLRKRAIIETVNDELKSIDLCRNRGGIKKADTWSAIHTLIPSLPLGGGTESEFRLL